MNTISAILGLMLTFSTVSFADVPEDLRGKLKENKLVVHMCELNFGNRIKSLFKENHEDIFRSAKCSILSDINYSVILKHLSNRSENPIIHSRETIDVKKGVDPRTGTVTGEPYWKTCDAEDGDCIEWSMGAFDKPVENFFVITQEQQKTILRKLIENSGSKNTNIYFLQHGIRVDISTVEGIFSYYNLKSAEIYVK